MSIITELQKMLAKLTTDQYSILGGTEVTEGNRKLIGYMKSQGLVESFFWTADTEIVSPTKRGVDEAQAVFEEYF